MIDYFKENSKTIDYKDTETLRKFLGPNARILNRKRTGLSSKNQRAVAMAVKRARYMGLLPYIES